MMAYLRRLWVAIDILVNVARGGKIETISSACGKQVASGSPCRMCSLICRLLDVFWPGHCRNNMMEPIE